MKRVFVPLVFCIVLVCVGYVVRVLFDFSEVEGGRVVGEVGDIVDAPLNRPLVMTVNTDFGGWTEEGFAAVVRRSADFFGAGDRINFLSEKFLGIPYEGNTLVGSVDTPEKLTIHFAGLDCFTYLDYVEAARQSDSYNAFVDSLRYVRYVDGVVAYQHRKHFFSDWVAHSGGRVRDVTREVGGGVAVSVEKHLNQKKDGSVFLVGVPVVSRTITYIPTAAITDGVISNFRTGDYIGIYTDIDGLDVTHTGILVKKGSVPYLRHASSRKETQRVLDEPLLEYLKTKPGIVAYRPY